MDNGEVIKVKSTARRAGDASRNLILLWSVSILLVVMVALLIRGPMSVEQQKVNWVTNLQVTSHVRLLLNSDTAEFMRLGYDPSGLLVPDDARQSRPLFVVSAYVISWIFKPIALLLQPLVPTNTGAHPLSNDKLSFGLSHMVATYMAYIAINVALLVASLFVLIKTIPIS